MKLPLIGFVDLTPFGRNSIIVLIAFIFYALIGGFSHTIITGILTLFLLLTLAFQLSIDKDEDLDVMGAMCINDRGFYNPKGTTKPPNTQNCMAFFEKRLNWDSVRPLMIEKLFRYRRFECIGMIDPHLQKSTKVWNTKWVKCDMSDPAIIDEIVQYHKVSNDNELYELIDEICNTKLVAYLPQWRIHYIDNLDGLSCWLWRVSHGIADGLRLVTLCSELFETADGNPIEPPSIGKLGSKTGNKYIDLGHAYFNRKDAQSFYQDSRSFTESRRSESILSTSPSASASTASATATATATTGTVEEDITAAAKDTTTINNNKNRNQKGGFGKYIKLFCKIANPRTILNVFKDIKAVNDMLSGPFDTKSPFKPDYTIHCPSKQKTYRPKINDHISLDHVKAIKKHYNASVNDVLTALFAGALRTYILSQKPDYFKNRDMSKYRTNALVAFGFPPKDRFRKQYDWLKNGFTFVSWPIPVEYSEFGTRVLKSQENGRRKKASLEAPLAMLSTNLVCRLGLDSVIENGTTGAFERHSCVFSNVPGFTHDIYFQGSKVVKMEASYFNVIPQLILMSYKSKIFVTLVCDPQRFPNAQIIVDSMVQECQTQFDALSK